MSNPVLLVKEIRFGFPFGIRGAASCTVPMINRVFFSVARIKVFPV